MSIQIKRITKVMMNKIMIMKMMIRMRMTGMVMILKIKMVVIMMLMVKTMLKIKDKDDGTDDDDDDDDDDSKNKTLTKFYKLHFNLLPGTDQKPGSEGGTWLGMSKDGRFGALTNYRTAPELIDPHARSRGHLVMDFLKETSSVQSYLDGVSQIGSKYNGFNLLIGQLSANQNCQFGWYTNMEGQPITVLGPGTHVLSNRLLNYPWPKVVYGRQRFEEIIGKTNTKKQLIADLILMLNEKQR